MLTINECAADAFFMTGEEEAKSDYRHFFASSIDTYMKNGMEYTIAINKNCIVRPYRDNYYFYVILFQQPNTHNVINIKQVLIASEYDSVVINAPYVPDRNVGLKFINDAFEYSYDPGKVNRVILRAESHLLIRFISTQNKYYDFYATPDFIECAQKVARWS